VQETDLLFVHFISSRLRDGLEESDPLTEWRYVRW
jgi:hypothetical protein